MLSGCVRIGMPIKEAASRVPLWALRLKIAA